MKDWISLFEKYRTDRRLLDLYLNEFACLGYDSPRKSVLAGEIDRLERSTDFSELLLAHYDHKVSSARDALQYADERLFLTYHYVKGLSMEECAEEMQISRDTIYRIRRRIMRRGAIPEEIILICQKETKARDARRRVRKYSAILNHGQSGKYSSSRSKSRHPDILPSGK